ncbi:biotin carboxylase, partial [Pseudomonas syringae pv. pisi]
VQSQGDSNAFSYEDIPARLHFAADSQAAIEQAIVQCMSILQTSIRAT